MKTWQDLQVGDHCLAFDADSWRKTGDVGDNSIFWIEGIITDERPAPATYNTPIIDVKFKDGRVSKGHFKRMVRPINH